MSFKRIYNSYKKKIDNYLHGLLKDRKVPGQLKKAMAYSLMAGGKRIRPVITLITYDIMCPKQRPVSRQDILNIAAALECIHTYSLIHDDLPAMDNDDLRRGKLTNHKKYNEATAILAGDGLLTFAFELCSSISSNSAPVSSLLARAAGPAGMVGGQVLDIAAVDKKITPAQLKKIHSYKTGALLSAAVMLPLTYLSEKKNYHYFLNFSRYIGLAFQIVDDILDVCADQQKLGKTIGSDQNNNKTTYVSLYGVAKAKKMAATTIDKALVSLQKTEYNTGYLEELARYILNRLN